MRYIVTTPWWLRILFPKGLTWNINTTERIIYLTFDDGPHPVATPFVLDELKKYNAKATFFCIGKNVQEQPAIYKRILLEGHRVGNHTHNHLNGRKTDNQLWLENVKEAAQWIDSDLLRPPYGLIRNFQAAILQQSNPPYRIMMWNVLSADFDTSITPEQCFEYVKKHTKEGSVVVFHDSEKALPNMQYALRKTLEFFSEKGYNFAAIQ
jgi:peptidoglycan-N-acetylglucosamine deacetylase